MRAVWTGPLGAWAPAPRIAACAWGVFALCYVVSRAGIVRVAARVVSDRRTFPYPLHFPLLLLRPSDPPLPWWRAVLKLTFPQGQRWGPSLLLWAGLESVGPRLFKSTALRRFGHCLFASPDSAWASTWWIVGPPPVPRSTLDPVPLALAGPARAVCLRPPAPGASTPLTAKGWVGGATEENGHNVNY